ncbi:MAG: hypothetical protein KME13_01715 [Myxacorys californica WJT36-NPBG1]|nr:hypothetical protein [Myxacorys californica WJT36-NPBG1]
MYTLTEAEFRKEAEPMLKRVFVDYDFTNQPFSSAITERRIVYPCGGSFDEAIPVKVLVSAATEVGDEGCYITSLWEDEGAPRHCYVSLSELLVGYGDTTGNDNQMIGINLGMDIYELDSVIYSAQGRWGIMMCHEYCGLLGGSPDFMAMIESGVPSFNMQVYDFFERYRGFRESGIEPTLGWLPPLLSHIYGQEVAKVMLAKSHLGCSLYKSKQNRDA